VHERICINTAPLLSCNLYKHALCGLGTKCVAQEQISIRLNGERRRARTNLAAQRRWRPPHHFASTKAGRPWHAKGVVLKDKALQKVESRMDGGDRRVG